MTSRGGLIRLFNCNNPGKLYTIKLKSPRIIKKKKIDRRTKPDDFNLGDRVLK